MSKPRRPDADRRLLLPAPRWNLRRLRLYTLYDQGPPVALQPVDVGVQVRDQSWGAQAKNFLAANQPQFRALSLEPILSAVDDTIRISVRPGGVVGAVPFRAPDSRRVAGGIVVRPRYGWEGIGPLLTHIGWSAHPKILNMPLVPGSAREIPAWVLAGPALQRRGALAKSLKKGFRVLEGVPVSPRGQILWHRYVTAHAARGAFHQVPCRYPEIGPDLVLRSYLRWGIESVHRALTPHSAADLIARQLRDLAAELLLELQDVPATCPDHHGLDTLRRSTGLPSEALERGLDALGWIVDERGLAGRSQADGLAWALPMHDLFERWVEHLVRNWARGFGGEVLTGRTQQTTAPIRWLRPGQGSLLSLIPDLVVQQGDNVYILDAKYKNHMQDLDGTQWLALSDEIREQHRYDIHQALAYTTLFDGRRVTAALVYPLHSRTWERLRRAGQTVIQGQIDAGTRSITLALIGVPIQVEQGVQVSTVAQTFERLRLV